MNDERSARVHQIPKDYFFNGVINLHSVVCNSVLLIVVQ